MVQVVVPGRQLATAGSVVAVWVMLAVATGAQPAWAPPALFTGVLAAGPIFALIALWAMVTRRVVIASADGVRVVRRPFALWDVAWIPRRELGFVAIEERVREVDGSDPQRMWAGLRDRPTEWAVVAKTHAGTVTLATGYLTAEGAKDLADSIRRATGC